MLTRIHGKCVFECDGCSEIFESETADFELALGILKEAEWQMRMIKGEWCHYCPTCPAPQGD